MACTLRSLSVDRGAPVVAGLREDSPQEQLAQARLLLPAPASPRLETGGTIRKVALVLLVALLFVLALQLFRSTLSVAPGPATPIRAH